MKSRFPIKQKKLNSFPTQVYYKTSIVQVATQKLNAAGMLTVTKTANLIKGIGVCPTFPLMGWGWGWGDRDGFTGIQTHLKIKKLTIKTEEAPPNPQKKKKNLRKAKQF